jgi:ribosomal protein S18 acetylase RimI-like enzyme
VARSLVVVREATPDDLPAVLELWRQQRDLVGRAERLLPEPSFDAALALIRRATQDPHTRLTVATLGEAVVGLVVLTHQPFAALFDVGTVHLHYLQVHESYRRRGVGHALVAAAASFAEDVGAEHLVCSVSPNLREANRFYAQLGFAAVSVDRVAPVPAVRRRLASDRRHGALDELLSRRRSLRSRTRSRSVEPREPRPLERPLEPDTTIDITAVARVSGAAPRSD